MIRKNSNLCVLLFVLALLTACTPVTGAVDYTPESIYEQTEEQDDGTVIITTVRPLEQDDRLLDGLTLQEETPYYLLDVSQVFPVPSGATAVSQIIYTADGDGGMETVRFISSWQRTQDIGAFFGRYAGYSGVVEGDMPQPNTVHVTGTGAYENATVQKDVVQRLDAGQYVSVNTTADFSCPDGRIRLLAKARLQNPE